MTVRWRCETVPSWRAMNRTEEAEEDDNEEKLRRKQKVKIKRKDKNFSGSARPGTARKQTL